MLNPEKKRHTGSGDCIVSSAVLSLVWLRGDSGFTVVSLGCRQLGGRCGENWSSSPVCQQMAAINRVGSTWTDWAVLSAHRYDGNESNSTWMDSVLQPTEAAHAGAEAAGSEAAAGAEASKTEGDSGSVSTSRESSCFSTTSLCHTADIWETRLRKEICSGLEKCTLAASAVAMVLLKGQS